MSGKGTIQSVKLVCFPIRISKDGSISRPRIVSTSRKDINRWGSQPINVCDKDGTNVRSIKAYDLDAYKHYIYYRHEVLEIYRMETWYLTTGHNTGGCKIDKVKDIPDVDNLLYVPDYVI